MTFSSSSSNTRPLQPIIVMEKRKLLWGLAAFVILLVAGGYFGARWELDKQKDYENQISDLKQANDSLRKSATDTNSILSSARDEFKRTNAGFERVKTLADDLKDKADKLGETEPDGHIKIDLATLDVLEAVVDLKTGIQDLEKKFGEFDGALGRLQEKVIPPQPALRPVPEKIEQTVYITNTGKKYHRDGCQYLRRSQIPIKKSEAIDRGYDPCSRCNP